MEFLKEKSSCVIFEIENIGMAKLFLIKAIGNFVELFISKGIFQEQISKKRRQVGGFGRKKWLSLFIPIRPKAVKGKWNMP